ncbi:cytochrome oxidase complex assembly protein 1-domain-containing protein [Podospora fimiseda]|uniref:Cytochrome oxidase complex assembly protein 1-domain-containing protein n=1 Tax=Podospora fimiseda TaxID=252190 RepID=A0AAN7H3V5_9PEZI|nr:cytochrome oxidase complex assembly protein 1-domain-containing protein [Podospora fimiseda]
MLSRLTQQRAGALLCRRISFPSIITTRLLLPSISTPPKRSLISPPKPQDGPLLERRPDRELPNIEPSRWTRTLPIFISLIALASIAIFNYQKLSSPIVSATLYALRTSEKGRAALGENIYFAQQIPWISGEMNQVRGRINISFRVKGTKGQGVMHFASFRPSPRGVFETTEWWLEYEQQSQEGGGKKKRIDLLEDGDPFKGMTGASDSSLLMEDDGEGNEVRRGYRK